MFVVGIVLDQYLVRCYLNMADIHITQAEADALIAMDKHRIDDTDYSYPALGGSIRMPLQSADKREQFVLDVSRSQINLAKGTYQNRARSVVILARLDFGGAPHRNPDDAEIASPHLHVYREGYGDKWAVPIPASIFNNIADPWQTLFDFMKYVNVETIPNINRTLFL